MLLTIGPNPGLGKYFVYSFQTKSAAGKETLLSAANACILSLWCYIAKASLLVCFSISGSIISYFTFILPPFPAPFVWHTHLHMHIHNHRLTHTLTHTHTYIKTQTHTPDCNEHTHLRTYRHTTQIYIYRHSCTHTHTQADRWTHSQMHTRTHVFMAQASCNVCVCSYHGHISLKNGFGDLGEYDGLSAQPTKATRAGKSSQQVTWKTFFFLKLLMQAWLGFEPLPATLTG